MSKKTAKRLRLAWCTDIHLDFADDKRVACLSAEAEARADALLVTGDIGESHSLKKHLQRLRAAFTGPIYFILGNHDRYGTSLAEAEKVAASCEEPFRYLSQMEAVALSPTVGLVGEDGLYDARAGKVDLTRCFLRDFNEIEEFATAMGLPKGVFARETILVDCVQQAARAGVDRLAVKLEKALNRFEHVIVATHVPPFIEASWHRGKISDQWTLPWYSAPSMGDMIFALAMEFPEKRITVFAGHSHHFRHCKISNNVEVYVGSARYGWPTINRILYVGKGLDIQPLTREVPPPETALEEID